MRKVGFSLKS
jgi:hypothetical protein